MNLAISSFVSFRLPLSSSQAAASSGTVSASSSTICFTWYFENSSAAPLDSIRICLYVSRVPADISASSTVCLALASVCCVAAADSRTSLAKDFSVLSVGLISLFRSWIADVASCTTPRTGPSSASYVVIPSPSRADPNALRSPLRLSFMVLDISEAAPVESSSASR